MIDRGAFFMGWHMGQMLRGLRDKPQEPQQNLYDVSFENGILYIRKAPAMLMGTVLSLTAADVSDANMGG